MMEWSDQEEEANPQSPVSLIPDAIRIVDAGGSLLPVNLRTAGYDCKEQTQ